jgi:DNA-cytosine methyltransferase
MQHKIIVSAFDGCACARVALDRIGLVPTKYYGIEWDKYAAKISAKNYPDIIPLGDICNVQAEDIEGDVFLLIGGPPCQGFSSAGKGKGFEDPRSKMLYEYVRLLKQLKPRYFIMENVGSMSKKNKAIISALLGVQPLNINSARTGAQFRNREYWTNINLNQVDLFGFGLPKTTIPQPKLTGKTIKDILFDDVAEKYYLSDEKQALLRHRRKVQKLQNTSVKRIGDVGNGGLNQRVYSVNHKSITVNTKPNILVTSEGKEMHDKSPCIGATYNYGVENYGSRPFVDGVRKLTPVECERLQNLPDNYTEGVSDSQRYKMIGNGFDVDTIAYLLSFMEV